MIPKSMHKAGAIDFGARLHNPSTKIQGSLGKATIQNVWWGAGGGVPLILTPGSPDIVWRNFRVQALQQLTEQMMILN